MKKHSVHLTPEQLDRLTQLDMNIAHWSTQHTTLVLQADQAKANASGLHIARVQLMNEIGNTAGVDMKTILQRRIVEDKLEILCGDSETEPEGG